MNAPSAVSISDMPAAKSSGSEMIARKGPRRSGDRETRREGEDDARVTEGEEEAGAERPLAALEERARRVVDGRDVIGVERMPEAERVRKHAQAGERGVARGVVGEEPPAEHV